ncbi:iron-containing alcohol dehydrogenase [Bradyrhizobium sp. RD5-C2]|uniref:iron-containing alcohol dehydrogenase n=1 Tax=Bradyrhizobium sp. RD5-C2 TaxID=244562 RepID=UPI001CC53AE5|nr:iron-containing alcohol dehydrogenase [Bradyrhizobium sp. RD5-C2]GIQ78886.1 NAD-dependent 4-hydroxybutyrate dehydrogenase [Bradyrhizobium sp. RD5-C2]
MALITYLTTIRFRFGEADALGDEIAALGIRRPMLVTDRGIVAAGLAARVTASLGTAPVVFDATPPNPTERATQQALARYREAGCDGLVALGGGSPIDLAKAVALLASHEGPLAQYAAIDGGVARITAAVAPVIAIPTTAGTGSEVGRAALITLEDGRKVGLISPHLIPARAICDPLLTLGLPPALTAATGMDALSHCVETYLSPRFNPPADAIALDGAARIVGHLKHAVTAGDDRDARAEVMMGALQGGLCFQKGLGAVHGLSHALGSLASPSLHHGTLNAVLMPAVMRYNGPVIAVKLPRLRLALGLADDADVAAFFAALNAELNLPRGLRAMGVPASVLDDMAEKAARDHSTATNPRPVDADGYRAIFQAAWE